MNLRQEIISAQKKAVIEANSWQVPGFQFSFVSSVGKIQFFQDDIANDCHHPSVAGAEKIAKELYWSIFH